MLGCSQESVQRHECRCSTLVWVVSQLQVGDESQATVPWETNAAALKLAVGAFESNGLGGTAVSGFRNHLCTS
jgi:hypothetical protein